jgi:hypothetical protein
MLASCACIVLVLLAIQPSPPGVTKANFDRIEIGMARADVETILGSSKSIKVRHYEEFYNVKDQWNQGAFVWFDEHDKTIKMLWVDSDETILQKLRRWLHLR